MKRYRFFILSIFVLLLTGYVFGEEEEENAVKVKLDGYYRVRGISYSNSVYINPDGVRTKDDKTAYIQQRLRLEPEIQIVPDELSIKMQADVFDDVIWGDNSCFVNGEYDPSAPGCVLPALAGGPSAHGWNYLYQYEDRMLVIKRAWAEVKLPVGKLVFGRMPSHWGLGLLENDGNGFRNEWGDAHYGDNRDRIEFVTKPGGKDRPYYLAIGYDKTVEGIIPQTPGQPIDDVDQWFVTPFYCAPDCLAKPPQVNTFGGAFVAYRVQPSTDTKVIVSDGYFMQKFLENFKIQVDVLYLGGATKALGDYDEDGVVDNITVNVINGVLRGTYTLEPLQAVIEVGYAGGDKDASYRDRRITAYTWDPDYNVGLLMFEELQARQSSSYAQYLARTGQAINDDLIPLVATKGGVKNATYVMFTPKFFLGEEENPLLATKLSLLWARLNEPALSPIGGTFVNGKVEKDLGFELDWGIEFGTNFKLGVQLGYLWAGKAFQDTNGDTENMFTSQLRLTVPF